MRFPHASEYTLLCVDDEPNVLSALRRLLRNPGYRVLTAEGGKAALHILEQETVHLIISDMRMPEMTGAEFLGTAAQRWPRTIRILLTGYSDLNSTVEAINRGAIYRYVSKPWEDMDLLMAVQRALEQQHLTTERERLAAVVTRQNQELRELNANLEAKVKARTEEIQQTADMLDLAYHELKRSYVSIVPVFANFAEMREGAAGGHSRRVAEMARILARQLDLDEDEVEKINFAALLHDIGKLSMPDVLLKKPFEAMKREERVQFMRHPVIGQTAFTGVDSMQGVGLLIRSHHERFDMQGVGLLIRGHHERYDGLGYPDGLRRDAIPLGARILAVVNDFDALQFGSLVNGKLNMAEARAFLAEYRGSRYDPRVLDVFLAWLDTNPEIAARVIDALRLTSDALRPGMILARHLVNQHGVLLFSRGTALDEYIIDRIKNLEAEEGHRITIHVKRRSDGATTGWSDPGG
jgi:response regulator RpfG family c-di-GMP phosphodiesterase